MTAVEVEVVSTGLQPITYPVTDVAIALKRQQYAALKADTPSGYESVRVAIGDCRKARVAIEARRKELKADSLEFGRRVDQQARALTEMLAEIEAPLQLQKDAVDEAKEQARLAAEQAERERVEAEIRAKREAEEAEAKRLRDIEDARLASEAERLRIEREVFEREKAEREAVETRAREAREAEEAKQRAENERAMQAERDRLRAEQEKLAAKRKAEEQRQNEERAKIEAERRKVEEARLSTERAEADRQARIRAEEEAKAKAERDRIFAEETKRHEERRAAEHAAELQALKSDAAKIIDLAESIEGLVIPKVKAAASKRLIERTRESLMAIATGLREVSK